MGVFIGMPVPWAMRVAEVDNDSRQMVIARHILLLVLGQVLIHGGAAMRLILRL